MLDVEGQRRQRRGRSAASIGLWRDLLVATERLEVPCPRGLHHATYQRPVNEDNRLLEELNALPRRNFWPHLRKAYEVARGHTSRRLTSLNVSDPVNRLTDRDSCLDRGWE